MAKGPSTTARRFAAGMLAVILVMALVAAACLAGGDQAVPSAGPLSIAPGAVHNDSLLAGSTERLSFEISNGSAQPVRLLLISAECDCSFGLPDRGEVPAYGHFNLEADLLLADAEPGPFRETITILTDHPGQRTLWIPVTGTVVAEGNRRTAEGTASAGVAGGKP